MQAVFSPTSSRNWLYFSIRWLLLTGFTIAIFLTRLGNPPAMPALDKLTDLIGVVVVGAIATGVLAVFQLIPQIRPYIVFAKLPGDWLIAFLFVYLAGSNNPAIVLGITGALMVTGILRLGAGEGLIQAIGVFVAATVGLLLSPGMKPEFLVSNAVYYAPLVVFPLLLLISTALWSNTLEATGSSAWKTLKSDADTMELRLSRIQESTRSFAEMAASLNSTLEYNKVLETALNIGRLNLRGDSKQRAVAVALMVETDDYLEVAVSRGLTHSDMERLFEGSDDSIVGRVLRYGEVEIMGSAYDDPELGPLTSFRGIESLLCIPLRADYTTYGVLLFGSTIPNAFNADNVELLKSLGVQVTVALKNAVLYSSLQDEKKRLVELERNGRQSLVRDLHDTVTQTVSAVKMRLQMVPRLAERNPEQMRIEVDEMIQMTSRAVEEMRHVMFALRPLVLENQGLSAAVMELKDRLERTYKQKMAAEVDFSIEPLLELDQKEMLFYLIEEATTNSRKYAEASLITVKIAHEKSDVVIRISDNGKGFDASRMRRGTGSSYGMVNMQQRAELAGGTLSVMSSPGKGTHITVKIPVEVTATAPVAPMASLDGGRKKIKKERSGPLSPST